MNAFNMVISVLRFNGESSSLCLFAARVLWHVFVVPGSRPPWALGSLPLNLLVVALFSPHLTLSLIGLGLRCSFHSWFSGFKVVIQGFGRATSNMESQFRLYSLGAMHFIAIGFVAVRVVVLGCWKPKVVGGCWDCCVWLGLDLGSFRSGRSPISCSR